MKPAQQWLSALLLTMLSCSAWSLTVADISRIQTGSRMEVPKVDSAEPGMETITVESVSVVTDSEGDRWYRIDAKHADQSPAVLVLQMDEGRVEVESMTASMKPRDLGTNPKMIRKMGKQGQGELTSRNKSYRYSDDESDDGKLTPIGGASVDISYYRFTQADDNDLSLLVFEWADDKFEILHLESVDGEKVRLY